MVRTYTISADDHTLTLHDVFAGAAGAGYETTAKYTRLSPGKSIFGEWQSVSIDDKTVGEAMKLVISPFEADGLSFSVPADKHLLNLA
jgi:FlaG/FlaF family flagellin (archaellin)